MVQLNNSNLVMCMFGPFSSSDFSESNNSRRVMWNAVSPIVQKKKLPRLCMCGVWPKKLLSPHAVLSNI